MYNSLKNIALKVLPAKQLKSLEPLLRPVIRLFYSGDAVSCPICEKSYSKFIQLREEENSDQLCPYCSSIQRKRLLWLYLEKECGIHSEQLRVLDFTPHPTTAKRIRQNKNVDYLTTDYESKRWDQQYDITAIPEKDASFDLVMCYHILEHVPDDRKAMAELLRIVKANGRVLVQTPHRETPTAEDPSITDPAERLRLFGQDDHVRYYNRGDLVQRLKDAGFEVEELAYAQTFSAEEQGKLVLNEKELIFVCRKPA